MYRIWSENLEKPSNLFNICINSGWRDFLAHYQGKFCAEESDLFCLTLCLFNHIDLSPLSNTVNSFYIPHFSFSNLYSDISPLLIMF